MKITTQQIYQSKGRKAQQDLNSILKEWSWQGQPFPNAADFIKKMKPWIEERLEQQKEIKEFKKKWKIKKLSEIKGVELE